MEFKKFSSLENTYRQNLIDKVQHEGKDGGKWIATEKIHGANFSFWCDGKEIKVASRSQFVDGTFYNCQAVINKYSQGILDWCVRNNIKEIVIYGELFGEGVQKEVKYGQRDFRAFDVVIDGEVQGKIGALAIANDCGVNFSPIIKIGTFKECMQLPNTFQSWLTPDDCVNEDNFAEGLVIEPVNPTYFNNGSRVYFKNKTPAFSEKKRVPREKKVFELTEDESELLNDLLQYNTPQRVSNVISKIGNISNKDFGKIMGLTCQDIFEEFTKETEREPKKGAEENWGHFVKLLQAEVSKTVREEFLKHID
jgi:Rnl2 family RNA ligase